MDQTSVGWACQILFAESDGGMVVLDLVAMEPCPFSTADVPSGCPFTIQLRNSPAFVGEIEEWAQEDLFVTLRQITLSSRRWFWVSGRRTLLLMELASSTI